MGSGCIGAAYEDPGRSARIRVFSEVSTLFHEYGHALQHVMTTEDEVFVAGISGVEWDAVEICSMFMEEWLYVPAMLKTLGAHYETGDSIPDSLVDKLIAARSYRAGSMLVRQLDFGLTDLALHSTFDPGAGDTPLSVRQRIHHLHRDRVGHFDHRPAQLPHAAR